MNTILKHNIQYLTPPDDVVTEGEQHKEETPGSIGIQQAEGTFEERRAKFFEKHSAQKNASPDKGGDITSEQNKKVIEQLKADAEAREKERTEQKEEGEQKKQEFEKKGPGSNVPKILEDKRKAEKERDDFRAKIEEYETKTKPELEAKITELQTKIDSGDYSTKKEAEFQSKITELETKLRDEKDALVTENDKLRKTVAFYDIQQSEQFQKEYLEPVYRAHAEAVKALNEDERFNVPLRRVLQANAQVLRAQNAEERRIAVMERNAAITAITDELDDFAKDAFKDSMREYIYRAERHAQALVNHEVTTKEIKERARVAGEKAYAEHLHTWSTAFKDKQDSYKDDESLSDDDKEAVKDLKIDIESEMRESNLLARKTIAGETNIEEAISIVHKGRVYPALKAKIASLTKQLKDRDEIIQKLRAADTSGGGKRAEAVEHTEPGSKEEFYDKFRPSKR